MAIIIHNLLEKANILTYQLQIPVIPIRRTGEKKKHPALDTWTDRRDRRQLASQNELKDWFANGKYNLAVVLDKEFTIDIDGPETRRLFWDILLPVHPGESTRHKIFNTWRVMTPGGGEHITLQRANGYNSDGEDKKILSKIYGSITNVDGSWKHDMLEVVAHPKYTIQGGYEDVVRKYRDITDIRIEPLYNEEISIILDLLQRFKTLVNTTNGIAKLLEDFYHNNYRNNICWTLSGYLFKYGCSNWFISEIIRRVAMYNKDTDPLENRLNDVTCTCIKDPNSAEVSGYDKLLEVLTEAYNGKDDKNDAAKMTITKISGIMEEAAQNFDFHWQRGYNHTDTQQHEDKDDNDLKGIDSKLLAKLSPHIYGVISDDPPVMYVAHKAKRKIIKAVAKFANETTSVDDGNGRARTRKTPIQLLQLKYRLISAIPLKVKINKSPIEETKTYHVTFIDKSDKPFTIGPCSINSLIEELANEGKVIKKAEAVDALKTIIERHAELGQAEISESVTTQGYYYINGKFETHNITQIIDKEPDLGEVKKCIEFLDELSTKWKNDDIFPTVIKWWTLAPFGYIFKNVDRWLQGFHEHGWSSSGKSSFGKIGLAMWRLHTNKFKKEYRLRFSNIDSQARLGNVISRSTYPPVVNEVGGLQDRLYSSLVETIKGAIEAPYVRGKYHEGKYQNIPSLCNMFFTSNPPPPIDSGYRSRTVLVHFSKDDVHERGQKEAVEFERWLDSNLNTLGVLGDFITRYTIIKPMKPEESILLSSDKSFENMAKEIITEFYKSAGKDKPEWLDRIYEQRSIVEENTERAYFELRGFLMDQVTNAYSRHIRTLFSEQDSKFGISFSIRLNFCLKNKLLPYLHQHTRRDGIEEIIITHDILAELKRAVDHIEGITTLEDLGKEVSGFEYCQRKLGGINRKVLAGPRTAFVKFLEGEVNDAD